MLHIGNILNNGYLHCKYLRKNGVSADSLNVDYRHCQGQPEWAEVHITEPVDEFNPDWGKVDLKGFQRPKWFYDVELKDIEVLASFLNERETRNPQQGSWQTSRLRPSRRIWHELVHWGGHKANKILLSRGRKQWFEWLWAERNKWLIKSTAWGDEETLHLGKNLVRDYIREYPSRTPALSMKDIYEWLPRGLAYRPMLKRYQIIQAYALDPMYVLLGNPGQPFICYEHGTLRDFPFEDSARGRLYSLCLKKAEKVIITNADCKRAAERLNLQNYVFIPHIIDDDLFRPEESRLKVEIQRETGCKFILVAPSRHHWKHCPPGLENSWLKRNDILIRGLGRFFRARPKLKALVIFFEWGQEVPLSKELIRECGFAERVRWMPIQSKPGMKEFYNAADIVLDQFNDGIGTFGGVVPEAMACAKPVLLNYKKDVHTWCYPELPPALNAPDEEAIAVNLESLFGNPDYCREIGHLGRAWFQKYHSSRIVMERMIDIYKSISDKYRWEWIFEANPDGH